MKQYLSKFRRGFTIIELVVAASVLMIISTLVVVDFANNKRSARDTRRIADAGVAYTAVNQAALANGTSFLRMVQSGAQQPCDIPAGQQANPDVVAVGTGCVGANGRAYGKMNLKNVTTSGYGAFAGRTYRSNSITDALSSAGYLATVPLDPSSGTASQTDATVRDYVLIRACSDGMQHVGARGGLYAVWTGLENMPTPAQVDTSSKFPGGSKAGPEGQGANAGLPYEYDFAADTGEYQTGRYYWRGFAVGNGSKRTDVATSCDPETVIESRS